MRSVLFLTVALTSMALADWSSAGGEPLRAGNPARTDFDGDPLPAGAVSRLGSSRWRHSDAILSAAYLGDGRQMITGSQDGAIRVRDAATGREVRTFNKTSITAVPTAFSAAPDGRLVACMGDGFVLLYDVAAGAELRSFKTARFGVPSVVFTPDGRSVIVRDNQVVVRYAVADGKELRRIACTGNLTPGAGGEVPCSGMALADDGKTLIVPAIFHDGPKTAAVLKRWELETCKELPSWKGPERDGLRSIALSPTAKVAALVTGDGAIRLWDAAAGKELPRSNAVFWAGGDLALLRFSSDGLRLAAQNRDKTIRVWDVASGKELCCLGGSGRPSGYRASSLAFTPDGKTIAAGDMTLRQWDVATGKEIGPAHIGGVGAIAASRDGAAIATFGLVDNIVRVWEPATGKELSRFMTPGNHGLAAFSLDGRALVVVSHDDVIRVWDVRTGKQQTQWKTPTNGFRTVAVAPNGKVAATCSEDQSIRIWDLAVGKVIQQILPEAVAGLAPPAPEGRADQMAFPVLAYSPDGALIAANPACHGAVDEAKRKAGIFRANVRNAITIYDVASGRPFSRVEPAAVGMFTFVFAPDGRTIASANVDGSISLWEVVSGKERRRLQAASTPKGGEARATAPMQQQGATQLRYTPDGKLLIGARDHDVSVWDAQTGQEIKHFTGHTAAVTCLALAPDSLTVVSGSLDGTALAWPLADLKPAHRAAMNLDAGRFEALWQDLANADARKAYEAMLTLAQAKGAILPMLRERVKPIPVPAPGQVGQWIADLDSNQFTVRRKAAEELERLGKQAEPDLIRALAKQPTLEMVLRIEELLKRLTAPAPPESEELRALRVVELLHLQGTAESTAVLESLAKGAAGARLTCSAQAAINGLDQRSPRRSKD